MGSNRLLYHVFREQYPPLGKMGPFIKRGDKLHQISSDLYYILSPSHWMILIKLRFLTEGQKLFQICFEINLLVGEQCITSTFSSSSSEGQEARAPFQNTGKINISRTPRTTIRHCDEKAGIRQQSRPGPPEQLKGNLLGL